MADSATADLVKQAIDHVRADLTKKGWTKIREVFGLPVDAAILGRHPDGGNWLFPIQVVQGRKPLPLVKFRRQAILDEAERSSAYVYLYTFWFTESGEMSHVSSGNLPDMPPAEWHSVALNETKQWLLLAILGIALMAVIAQLKRTDMVNNSVAVLLLVIACVLLAGVAYLWDRLR